MVNRLRGFRPRVIFPKATIPSTTLLIKPLRLCRGDDGFPVNTCRIGRSTRVSSSQ